MKFSPVLFCCVIAAFLLMTSGIDAKRKKNKSAAKSKTKTKWSTTMEALPDGANPMLATEEHGYYVKRTFVAPDGTLHTNVSESGSSSKSVPYLAIPIDWFPCPDGSACRKGYSAMFNTGLNAMSEGFLCDDDCTEPYEPICGKTATEVAVFYNKCKLNVAKCRTHGYWVDYPLEECLKKYPKELEYTDKKFRSSPYFKNKAAESPVIEGSAAGPIDAATTINNQDKQPEEMKKTQIIESTSSASNNIKKVQ